jgi:signal peptidase I
MTNTGKTAGQWGRKTWVAAVLSLFCTGLGHVYCGRMRRGCILFLLSLLFAPAAVTAALSGFSDANIIGVILLCLAAPCVYFFAIFDSCRIAKGLRGLYDPRKYNRTPVYALCILLGLAIPASLVLHIRANYIGAYSCQGTSMAPTILKGDIILVNKIAFRKRLPLRGEIIVYPFSQTGKRILFIKRVIALPGDSVAVTGNEVFVNGKKLEREPIPPDVLAPLKDRIEGRAHYENNGGRKYTIILESGWPMIPDFPETRVPEGGCFVLGDARDDSRDSRRCGFVRLEDVMGAVEFIHYPAASWKRFGTVV